ncbi:hypothetical protein COOONC_27510 [Cooperia oncophora]
MVHRSPIYRRRNIVYRQNTGRRAWTRNYFGENTFLHTNPKEKCRIVRVQVQDVEGRPHELELTTHEILIKPLRTPPLLQEDTEFLKSLNISIQHKWKEKAVKPLILLGCDQVWKFWKTDEPPVPLPSGLQLLPTKTGNLITGRYHHPSQVLEVQSSCESQKWDKYWSLVAIKQTKEIQETMEQVLREECQRMEEEEPSPQVQQLLQQHEEEVTSLKARISMLEQQMAKSEQMSRTRSKKSLIRDGENPAQNVGEASKDTSKPSKEHEKRADVKFLKEYEAKKQVLERMENALNSFPYRRYTQYSEGVEPWRSCTFCGARAAHYSDSCPTIRNALDRRQVVYTLKLCTLCLENCEEGRCIKGRRASKFEGTPFEDVIPHDKGHHRALCPVPDAKWRIEARVQAAVRELQEMERNRHSRRGMSRH